jgi:hypothetical protein
MKNWIRLQHFTNELMEGVEMKLCSQAIDIFDIGIQKVIPLYDVSQFRRGLFA